MAIHNDLTPQAIKAKLNLPPNLQDAFNKVTNAGMKTMYDPKTRQEMVQHLDGPGPMGVKLGHGVAQLILLMWLHSNKTLPPQVMVPAGIYLVSEAADFLNQTNKYQITDQDIAVATKAMIAMIMQAFKVSPQQAQQAAQQMQNGGGSQTPPATGIVGAPQGA